MTQEKAHAITGAFGYSGKYMATRLLEQGKRVVTLTNSPNRPNPFQGKVEARPLSFDNLEALTESLRDVEVLYNTYWVRFNHPLFTHADAVRNILTLFEAAKKAGVERIVHISVANADPYSRFEYFSGKGLVENALKASGLNYAILRPAVLFGGNCILINNIAWALRLLPVFCVFGDGNYHVQPIHVDDLAKLCVEQGASRELVTLPATGPEDFTYRELVGMLGEAIGCKRPVISLPAWGGYAASWVIGKIMGDVFATKEEIQGLMADLLHIPGEPPTGTIRLSDWARENRDTLGKAYANELTRRTDRTKAY